jgi:predicted nucleic acid-binding protein
MKPNKCYLDTNILIGYSIINSPHHVNSLELLSKLMRNKLELFVSPLVLDEFVYAYMKLMKHDSISLDLEDFQVFCLKMFEFLNLKVVLSPKDTHHFLQIIKFVEKFGLKPRDSYHLYYMKSNSIDYFATFDLDFEKVFESKFMKRFS